MLTAASRASQRRRDGLALAHPVGAVIALAALSCGSSELSATKPEVPQVAVAPARPAEVELAPSRPDGAHRTPPCASAHAQEPSAARICHGPKVSQCNCLIEIINAAAGQWERLRPSDAPGRPVPELCKVATDADRFASTVEQLDFGEQELRARAADYAKLIRDMAAITRQLAEAVERDKVALIQKADATLPSWP